MPKPYENTLNLLTSEQRERLQLLGKNINDAEKRLSLLKELGIGVTDLSEKLEWAKKRRDILLAKG